MDTDHDKNNLYHLPYQQKNDSDISKCKIFDANILENLFLKRFLNVYQQVYV